jgi:peptidoglycan/xylan/chitin deacetylase (PgdA/CDA1 family)
MPASKELISSAVRWSGLSRIVRGTIARHRASILLYHDPTAETLERHLEYLAKRYSFISLTELVDAMRGNCWPDLPPKPLVLTFDDGHRHNSDLADLFDRYGVTPTIYVCSQIVGTGRHYWFLETDDPEPMKPLPNAERLRVLERNTGYTPVRDYDDRQALSREEIRRIDGRAEIGAHTRFHPILTTCQDAECEAEIQLSKTEIESVLGVECKHFSYPNGDFASREIEYVRQAGFASARSTDIGWNDAGTDVFALKILGTRDDASVSRLATDLCGVGGYIARARQRSFRGRHRPVTAS